MSSLLDQIAAIKIRGQALNKPLLLLQFMSYALNGRPRLQRFRDIEGTHKEALRMFSLNKRSPHPTYAFWWLQDDGFWEINADEPLTPRKSNLDPKIVDLRKSDVVGGFRQSDFDELRSNPNLAHKAVQQILTRYFPTCLHPCLLDYFTLRPRESVVFRDAVIGAYAGVCAVSRVSSLTGPPFLAVQAVPIMWHEFGGPESPNNGIALSADLAVAFLMGAFTIALQGDTYRVLKSKRVVTPPATAKIITLSGGEPVSIPPDAEFAPGNEYLRWHRRFVFMG